MSRYISLVSPINHHRQASKKNIGKNILCVSKTKYIVYYLHDGTKSRSKLRSKTANEQNEEKRKERERERDETRPIEINPRHVSLNPQRLYFKTTKRGEPVAELRGPFKSVEWLEEERSNLLFQRGDSATKAEVLLLNLVHAWLPQPLLGPRCYAAVLPPLGK